MLIEFAVDGDGVKRGSEKQYRLVPPQEVTAEDLASYRTRLS